MNELELVFYGQRSELDSSVLKKMGVVHYRNPTDVLVGLFAVEKRYGSEIRKPLTADILGDHPDADWIIFRYLSPDEEKVVRENKQNKKIYVILHNYYSFHRLYESLLTENINQYSLVVDRFNPEIKTIHDVNGVVKTKNYFNLIKPKVVVEKNADPRSFDFSLWIMLVALAKILLNPINELNRYSILMKYSQARLLIRFMELFSFIVFLVRWVAIKLFYVVYQGLGLSKVVSIKAGFLTRHFALMSVFKIYGIFVDAFMYLYRLFRLGVLTPVYFALGGWLLKNIGMPVYNFFRFSVRHVVVIAAVKVYGVLFDVGVFLHRVLKLYFFIPVFVDLRGWVWRVMGVPVLNFFKFNVRHVLVIVSAKTYGFLYDATMWADRSLRLPVQNFFRFTVRHFFLMLAYKTYGLIVDTVLFFHRIGKLYLMYPVFKIYWFAAFQYKKRIKKYFA